MAKRKRNQRGRKKQEDTLVNVVEARDQAQGFLEENQNLVIGGIAIVLLVIGGIFAYNNFYKVPRQQEAVEQMFQAEFQFQRDSFVQALTNPGGGYRGFLEIIDEYGGTAAGNLANYYAGICYLNLGQYDAAISYLEDYSPKGDVTPAMKAGALGDAYSETGDFDKAMGLYKKAARAEDSELTTPYYLKKVGMLYEHQGNPSEALKAYTEIQEKYPNTAVARDIEKYLARVKSQG